MSATRITVVRRRTLLVVLLGILLTVVAVSMWMSSGWSTVIKIYDPTGFRADEVLSGSCWTDRAAQELVLFVAWPIIQLVIRVLHKHLSCPMGDPAKNGVYY